jgi:DNA-binding response OmpR family regulator
MQTILAVDDEPNILELVKLYLEREGYRVERATTGREAISKLSVNPALIILDLMLPDIDGLEVCKQVRARSAVPILMLTARKEDVDKIVGLEMGADDYLTKPFNPRELVARVKAILRRAQAGTNSPEVIEAGSLRIDLGRHEVTAGENQVTLRSKEFDLLVALAQNLGHVLSRERLIEVVWGYDYYGETRTVDVHVSHLREKLAGCGVDIQTLRGTGYKMVVAGGKA